MTNKDRWDALAQATGKPGVIRLRAAPESRHDLFIGIILPGARECFWYDVSSNVVPNDYRLPELRSVRAVIGPVIDTPTKTRVQLELENTELSQVFRAMIDDLISTIAATLDDDTGLAALSRRVERWRRLLETGGAGGLGTTDRRGLAGELIVLDQILDNGGSAARSVATWAGPYGKHQDFQAVLAAIEVKATVTKQPQSLIISSERELDRTGVPHLYLVHVSLDERKGGSGQSLNALVGRLRSRVSSDLAALSGLDDALSAYGYLNEQAPLYETPNYTVREQSAFEVLDGFPCITEDDLPTGVGDVTYRIQVAALQPFAVRPSQAFSTMVTS